MRLKMECKAAYLAFCEIIKGEQKGVRCEELNLKTMQTAMRLDGPKYPRRLE